MASDELVWKLRFQDLNSRMYSADTAFRSFLEKFNGDKEELISSDLFDTLNWDMEQLNKQLKAKADRLKVVCNALKWQQLVAQTEGISNEECAKCAEDIKDSIHLLKTEGNLIMTDLQQQQHLLERQISGLHQSYQDLDKKPCKKQNSPKKLKSPFAFAPNKNLPTEVVEFQEFMYLTRKHQQEWSGAEHSRFLKIWRNKKFESLQDLMRETEVELPSKFPEEILSHVEWYKEFLKRREKKINALKEWKDQKEKQVEKMRENVKEKNAIEAKWKATHQKIIQQRNDQVMNMFSWKRDKQNAIKQARDEEKKKARQKFLQQKKLQLKKVQHLKTIINEYHEKKRKLDLEVEAEVQTENMKWNCQTEEISKKIGKNWKRDKMIVSQRKRKIDELAKNRLPTKIHNSKGKRDPTRIFKSTKSSKAKVNVKSKHNNDDNEVLTFAAISEIPHRKIPSWTNCFNISSSFSSI